MTARSEKQARNTLAQKLIALTHQVHDPLRQMRDHILADVARSGTGARRASLDGFESFVHGLYDVDQLPVLGMGFLPHPEILADRKVLWWYNSAALPDARSTLRPLGAGIQPEAMDFYDTISTEWWQNAAGCDEPVESGPFVDISGTNSYIVTFALAVRVGQELLGVVAADVTVASLQTLCQNDLLDLPRPTSVVDKYGMVIATNAGALLGGVVEMSVIATAQSQPIGDTAWLITTGS